MRSEKLLTAILVFIVSASAAASIISTTVSAQSSATLEPTFVKDATRIKFTVTVTNETAENIDNIRIWAFATPDGTFTEGIGGASAAENLKLAADNMENAVVPLQQAGENLKLAAENKKAAGPDVVDAGENLEAPTQDDWRADAVAGDGVTEAADNVWINVEDAASDLKLAGAAMENASENFTYITIHLSAASSKLISAAATDLKENLDNWDSTAAIALDTAGDELGTASTKLSDGSLRQAGISLWNAGDNLYKVGDELADAELVSAFHEAGSALKDAGLKLQDAADYENNAGYNLNLAETSLWIAGDLIENADTVDLAAAGDNLKDAAAQIGYAADNMQVDTDDILQAGDNLSQAAIYLANAASELGIDLGGAELEDAMEHENAAAENLNIGDVDLGTAGDQLIAAASDLSAAASKMKSTASAFKPANWTMTDEINGVQFNSIAENYLGPGDTETYVFLLKTPDIDIENEYTVRVASCKVGSTSWNVEADITLTVDGKVPTLSITVTQMGVAENNLVGTVYDDARATITIVSDEELSAIGDVFVENAGQLENFLPPISLTTEDNITFTGTFTVGAWDDNVCRVRVVSAKDLATNENTTGMVQSFTVDTRAPIFIDNGLPTLISGMRANVTQAGTGENFLYVDNHKDQELIIKVEDNSANDNAIWVTSVTVDNIAALRDAVNLNTWGASITLSEGLNSILKVTATDRTGNAVSDNIENVFIDIAAPTIEFNTVEGLTWITENLFINVNTPEIKITVKDPGYPTTGLGIAKENLVVRVDDDDNFLNGSPYEAWGTLENKGPWDFGLEGVFENVIDNAGYGLADGTYWITVAASDNLAHEGEENQYGARSFIIDTDPPDAPSEMAPTELPKTIGIAKAKDGVTFSCTVEAYGTLKVYGGPDGTVLIAEVKDEDGNGKVSVSLYTKDLEDFEGPNTVVLTTTDLAGNESSAASYGRVTVDLTSPVITITSPADRYSTTKTTVVVQGTADVSTVDIIATTGTITGIPVIDNHFEYSVPLSKDWNIITVTGTDAALNTGSDTILVERKVTPWETYAAVIAIIAIILAAIAVLRRRS